MITFDESEIEFGVVQVEKNGSNIGRIKEYSEAGLRNYIYIRGLLTPNDLRAIADKIENG